MIDVNFSNYKKHAYFTIASLPHAVKLFDQPLRAKHVGAQALVIPQKGDANQKLQDVTINYRLASLIRKLNVIGMTGKSILN